MSTKLFKNESRGGADHGWLKTHFSYSFANYYDPERMGFGALRVVNDDWIAGGAGFPTHSHQDMEIITIPLTGALAHKDDAGGEGTVTAGMVQVMSAGTGVLHSEFNASKTDPATLFQIWIEPSVYGVAPRYQESEYKLDNAISNQMLLVGPEGKHDTWIHQDASISRLTVLAGEEYTYKLNNPQNGVYLMVITGEGVVFNHTLGERDALEIVDESEIFVESKTQMDILCIEIPLK